MRGIMSNVLTSWRNICEVSANYLFFYNFLVSKQRKVPLGETLRNKIKYAYKNNNEIPMVENFQYRRPSFFNWSFFSTKLTKEAGKI